MARKRDIIIAVIIGVSFVLAMGFFGLMFIGMMSGESDFEFASLGGDIGVVEVFGIIDESSGRRWIRQIDKWAESGSIEAIVIHINSGGGGAAISQEVYDAIRRAREEKPVVAAMASVAASGGYLIACGSDRIIANPSTLTGSIGVILSFHTAEDLLDKIGLGTETIKSGDLKDVLTYTRPMETEERLMIRNVVMDTYEQFVEVVAQGRGMEKEEVYPFADGAVFTGLQAYNHGLVDTIGGFREALDLAAELAGIDGDPEAVWPYERKRNTWSDLL
ncbi:MAG: signal peptide peptidase SppA, partial [candidate division Zixibacteria bacterium]|nr:signal peptide peptidase SppA [candidate division Zixibacteria bacterium]